MKKIFFSNVVLLLVLGCLNSYADGVKPSGSSACRENLYNQYLSYRKEVLSANMSGSKILNLLVVSSEKIDDVDGYLQALRLQEAGTKEIQEYYYRCSSSSGDLYLKLKNFEPDLTRAHIRFELVNDSLLIKYVSLERKSMEKYIDSEGDFILVEKHK